jgi:outer membrane autotransporter protein
MRVIESLTDPDLTDEQVRKLLDQLNGDLTANAMFMALKEPWRHPFNRLSLGCPIHKRSRFQRQLWGEFTARYEDVGYDGNAHDFTINRNGLAVGVDQRISFRSAVGLTFQYAEPRLRQETGRAKMDDHEIGLYAMTRLTNQVDMKVYLGYSHQQYDFLRTVTLPKLYEQLRGKTGGDAMSMSVELLRPMRGSWGLITPIAAFDFEHVWMSGYRESAGETALVYDNAALARAMLRFGLGSEYILADLLRLNLRIQYAAQLNDREYPAVGVRFANGPANQRTADIWGSLIGQDYLNVGVGTSCKLDARGTRLLYVNYDAKWFNRANSHIGEAGIVQRW